MISGALFWSWAQFTSNYEIHFVVLVREESIITMICQLISGLDSSDKTIQGIISDACPTNISRNISEHDPLCWQSTYKYWKFPTYFLLPVLNGHFKSVQLHPISLLRANWGVRRRVLRCIISSTLGQEDASFLLSLKLLQKITRAGAP